LKKDNLSVILIPMSDDYYKILEIPKTASQAEIQKAYRKLARKLHPDVNPDDPTAKQKFQKMQEAYDVLNSPEKRRVYDQFGVSPDQMGSGGGPQGPFQWSFGSGGPQGAFHGFRSPPRGGTGHFDINDFMQMFGGGMGGMDDGQDLHFGGSARPSRGTDWERTLTIPFTVSVLGGTVEMKLQRNGKEEKISVKIPAGIEDGKKIRLAGQGNPGSGGGKAGNLIVTVHIEEHPFFHRKAENLYVRVPISLKEAVFGAKIDVPTPTESVRVTIPPGSSSGTKLRLRGRGLRKSGNSSETGDLFVELSVALPTTWAPTDLALLESLQNDAPEKLRNDLRF
jgi:DnaJ-class molecular chaperone